jgi:hypothetical protein
MQLDTEIEVDFLTFFSKFFFRFGSNSFSGLINEFINNDGENLLKDGFFIFENLQSIIRRLENYPNYWAIIPDSRFHGSRFLLLWNHEQNINFFSIELKFNLTNHLFNTFIFEIQGEFYHKEVNATFSDVLNELQIDSTKGLPQEKSIYSISRNLQNLQFSKYSQQPELIFENFFLGEEFYKFDEEFI